MVSAIGPKRFGLVLTKAKPAHEYQERLLVMVGKIAPKRFLRVSAKAKLGPEYQESSFMMVGEIEPKRLYCVVGDRVREARKALRLCLGRLGRPNGSAFLVPRRRRGKGEGFF